MVLAGLRLGSGWAMLTMWCSCLRKLRHTFVQQALLMQEVEDDHIAGDQGAWKHRGVKRGCCLECVARLLHQLFHSLCFGTLVELGHHLC